MSEVILMVGFELIEVKIFIHVRLSDYVIEQIKNYEIWNVDQEKQFENRISLLKDRGFLFFEAKQ